MSDEGENLAMRITDLLEGEDFDTKMSALTNAIAFQLSLICPACLQKAKNQLEMAVPNMVDAAKRLYASGPPLTCGHH
jgi:hypothetical protein